jgi:hypothetical protein
MMGNVEASFLVQKNDEDDIVLSQILRDDAKLWVAWWNQN